MSGFSELPGLTEDERAVARAIDACPDYDTHEAKIKAVLGDIGPALILHIAVSAHGPPRRRLPNRREREALLRTFDVWLEGVRVGLTLARRPGAGGEA
jgi:anti-sigma factor RsiW